jgi:DNA-directed RNA polymerase specialized sigma24 family protein
LRIYYFLLKKTCNEPAAKDLTEKAFELLYLNRRKIESLKELVGFLYHTARKCSDLYAVGRSCTAGGSFEMPDRADLLALLYEYDIVINEMQVRGQNFIREMGEQRRAVVEMRLFLHMDIGTIAAELGVDRGIVQRHLDAAMAGLEKRLGSYYGGFLFDLN